MAVLEGITEADFEEYVFGADSTVLVAYVADWALPSHQIISALEWIAEKSPKPLRYYLFDADESPIPDDWKITDIPTLVLYAKGEEIGRIAGQVPLPRIHEWINASV